jgi:D-arabinose 5-phosphate isomerase GutQ
MSLTVTGIIERKGLGPGVWALISDSGETYELQKTPSELRKVGLKVTITGETRSDVMTFAMIGPVLEVHSFEVI